MKRLLSALVVLGLTATGAFAAEEPAAAAGEAKAPQKVEWSFSGPFGMYDRASLQRGFQVYKEVCSACHSLNRVAFRTLGDKGGPGFTEAEVKAIAAGYKVQAEPNDQGQTVDADGQPLTRAATPADYFPAPFANDKAARAANNGALPPDLSLIIKARAGHENYVYSILTGFQEKPAADEKVSQGMYYNPYFKTHQIAMPPPLSANQLTYADGTNATIEQEAHDVATFLSWASEPKMEERKETGMLVMLFLFALVGLLYFSYRGIWRDAH